MTHRARQGLKRIVQLTARDRSEIEALAAACKQHEPGLDLPLYLGPVRQESGETDNVGYYRDDTLVGFANLTPGDEIELQGMVHPAHRRRGTGRVLLDAAIRECQRRGALGLTLVCEAAAPSGVAFARAVGAAYRDAEHRMKLDRAAYARRPDPKWTLIIEPAGMEDLEDLLAIRPEPYALDRGDARASAMRYLGRANQRFYIGRLQDEPVGMLRLNVLEPDVFLQSFRVRPAYRGRGYGRQILTWVLDRLVAQDWARIMLEVATDNEVAMSLYESCGFRRVATYLYHWLPCPSV
jgi:ribosomal protein S18 acetylase RimI-like enzyme